MNHQKHKLANMMTNQVNAGSDIMPARPEQYYFTFGHNTNLKSCYIKIEASNYMLARAAMILEYKGQYAFQYTEEQFEGQAEAYDLIEVPIGTELVKY